MNIDATNMESGSKWIALVNSSTRDTGYNHCHGGAPMATRIQATQDEPERIKQVVAYLRVSTDQQEEGNGLDVQRQTITAFAAANKTEVTMFFEDVVSGAKEDRPELDKIRRLAASGALSTVLVYKLDRFARDTRIALNIEFELKVSGVKVVSVSEFLGEGPIGEMMKTIMFAFATFERSQIAARTKAGRRAKVARDGTYQGGPGVYGYRPVGERGAPGKGLLVSIESEGEVIRLAFKRRADGSTLQSIAEELNTNNHRTMNGGLFSRKQVQRILSRESFYRGAGVITRSVESSAACHDPTLKAS